MGASLLTRSRTFRLVVALVVATTLVGPSAASADIPPVKGTVTGYCVDRDTSANLPGIRIIAWSVDSPPSSIASTYTDALGNYTLDVDSGTLFLLEAYDEDNVYASRYYYDADDPSSATPFSLPPLETRGAPFHLYRAATAKGFCRAEATGGIVPGAGVLVQSASMGYGLAAGSAGEWSTRGLHEGLWRFGPSTSSEMAAVWDTNLATKDGYGRVWRPVSAGETFTADILLRHQRGVYRDVLRLAGADRFQTAARISREPNPFGWTEVWNGASYGPLTDVVIASGDDASLVDALSAGGLAGVLHAPLYLVSKNSVPLIVRQTIGLLPGPVTVHIVGGPNTISTTAASQLAALSTVGTAGIDRVAGTNRYGTAAAVAAKMKAVLGGSALPAAFIANGAEQGRFTDALALAPISARMGIPVLLVGRTTVPPETASAIAAWGATNTFVSGGSAAVSPAIFPALKAASGGGFEPVVMAGADRYGTAAAVAEKAIALTWSDGKDVGMASSVVDAVAGGAAIGSKGGVMLLTTPATTPAATTTYLKAHAPDYVFVLGGTSAVSEAQRLNLMNALNP